MRARKRQVALVAALFALTGLTAGSTAAARLETAPVASPSSGATLPNSCGRQKIAGKNWIITVIKLDCGTAKSVVARLAAKKVPAAAMYGGTYSGMKCMAAYPGRLPTQIVCRKAGGHSLTARQF